METLILLLLCGMFIGGVHSQTPNPECKDLEDLQKKFLNVVNTMKKSKLDCKPNSNCTGLNCYGTFRGRKVNATVILQGCHKPVQLVVHYGDHQVIVQDGSRTKLLSPLYAVTSLKKEDNAVVVSLKLETCLTRKTCAPLFPIITNQRIRVNCDGQPKPTVATMAWPYPNVPRPYLPMPLKNNPECKSLQTAKGVVERNFKLASVLYPGKINCHPSKDCSVLRCSGYAMNGQSNDSFTTSMSINYCSSPITMNLQIDVPNKDIHVNHTFKDGDKTTVYSMPITVHLKRKDNTVYVTIQVVTQYLVKDLAITVDPRRCPGYIPTPPPGGEKDCDRLNKLGRHVMNRKENIQCHSDTKCKKLICSGKYGSDNFTSETSISHCTSPITLTMKITVKNDSKSHTFKDGDVYKTHLPVKVELKRWYNDILVNISINRDYFVLNHIFVVDPNECGAWDGNQCDSLNTLGRHIENSKEDIQCTSDPHCKKLKCIGKYGSDSFNSATSINHCIPPITLHMVIKTKGKKYVHTFKDGEMYKMPLPVKVGLKRWKNDILVNISVNGDDYVLNHVFKVNPKQCKPGTSGKSSGLSGGAIGGIVVAVIILIVLIIAVVLVTRKKMVGVRVARYNDLAMSDDTAPLYDDFEPALA